jgi:type IV pilus assembly protein PilA
MQDTIKRLRAKTDDEGFTLIELLVVVVIIGVLVAIAVPVYLNYREGAADKSAQSDVRGAISAVEQFYTNNCNAYPDDVAATSAGPVSLTKAAVPAGCTAVTAGTVPLSNATTFQYKLNASSYVICAGNSGGTKNRFYVYNSANGGSVKASTQTTLAACITNGN